MHENMHLFADWKGVPKHTVVVMQTDRCICPAGATFGTRNVKICPQTLK